MRFTFLGRTVFFLGALLPLLNAANAAAETPSSSSLVLAVSSHYALCSGAKIATVVLADNYQGAGPSIIAKNTQSPEQDARRLCDERICPKAYCPMMGFERKTWAVRTGTGEELVKEAVRMGADMETVDNNMNLPMLYLAWQFRVDTCTCTPPKTDQDDPLLSSGN